MLPEETPIEGRGSKRKWQSTTTATNEGIETILLKKLHHEVKEVRKAAKKAKTFETQKLVKRLKDSRRKNSPGPEISDLEVQLSSLKALSHDQLANSAFRSKILKDKILSPHSSIQDAIAHALADLLSVAEVGTPTHKLQLRLLSSKTLASAISESIELLRAVIQPGSSVTTKGSKNVLNEEQDRSPVGKTGDRDSESNGQAKKRVKLNGEGKGEAIVNGDDDEQSSDEPHADDSDNYSEVHEDDANVNEARPSIIRKEAIEEEDDADVDDDGWESGMVDGSESESGSEGGEFPTVRPPMNYRPDLDSNGGTESDNDIPSSSAEENQEESDGSSGTSLRLKNKENKSKEQPKNSSAPKSRPVKPTNTLNNTTSSTFLPSLAVGFVPGGSDSDCDEEAKVADLGARKNRRGQRARRAIWEKKYGRNANHKKKEVEGKPNTSANGRHNSRQYPAPGHQSHTKATPIAQRPSMSQHGGGGRATRHRPSQPEQGQQHQAPDSGWVQHRGNKQNQVSAAEDTKNRGNEKPIHPSWEAKRRLKEKEGSKGAIIPAQGKKIKFAAS